MSDMAHSPRHSPRDTPAQRGGGAHPAVPAGPSRGRDCEGDRKVGDEQLPAVEMSPTLLMAENIQTEQNIANVVSKVLQMEPR